MAGRRTMTGKRFDTLIMTTPADFKRLQRLYPRIAEQIPDGKIIFIGSSEVVQLVREAGFDGRITAMDENELLPYDDVHICMTSHMAEILAGRDLPRGVTGWYYQQFLKYAYANHCEEEYYLTWDGDTIPCRTLSMFKEETDTPFLDLKHEFHAEYFETMGRLVPGLEKAIGRSFISEHMLFNCGIVQELMLEIEKNEEIPGTRFWEKIIRAIPPDLIQSSAFSEFETYGTFVAHRHPSVYRLRDWHSFRLGGEFFDPDSITDRDFAWLGKDFDAISFEKGMSVREDHKNLFNNSAYQEKLTPRQMLEAAQKVFKDGYLEVWEEDGLSGTANRTSGAFIGDQTVQAEKELLQPDTWKTYAELGARLLESNPDQAYLCYENALFLYNEDRVAGKAATTVSETPVRTVRESLEEVLQLLRESGELSVQRTAIVILSYNQSYLMQKCLESLRAYCDPEACSVLVLDNASTDGVADYLKEQKDISLLLSDENLGFPKGCNEAVRAVPPGMDILFLNNDTRMTPNALFWLRMALYKNGDTGAAGAVTNYAADRQRIDLDLNSPEEYVRYGAGHNIPPLQTEEADVLSGFALLVKRHVLEETGGFDEAFSPGYLEDADLCIRIRNAGYKLLLCRNSFIYHAGSQSFRAGKEPEELFDAHFQYLLKKWGEEALADLFPGETAQTPRQDKDTPEHKSEQQDATGFIQVVEQLKLAYQQGEQFYTTLREQRPEDTDIIISPRQIGDTVWLCAFVKAYKEQHGCRRILMVLPENQKELPSFFPDVDLLLPASKASIMALRIYIGIHELWKQPHIIYAHHPFIISLQKDGMIFDERIEVMSMLKLNRGFLGLKQDTMPQRMTVPDKPFSGAYQERYQNTVMLMPGVNSLNELPKAFWATLAKRLREKGLRVLSNYNGVDCEYVVEGTEPLGTTFTEMVELSRYIKAFVSTRSGICDLLAGTDAKLVCLWPTREAGTGIGLHPEDREAADPAALGRSEGIWNFQYQAAQEEELLDQIMQCVL